MSIKMNVRSISASNFKKGEDILKDKLKDKYSIINVESKRRWFVGPRYCKISYLDLTIKDVKSKTLDSVSKEPSMGENQSELDINKYVDTKIQSVEQDVGYMKDMMESLMGQVSSVLQDATNGANRGLNEVKDVLINNGVIVDVANEIIKDVSMALPRGVKDAPKNTILIALKDILERKVNTSEGYDMDSVKTIMLVGPTGVGKTTTLAKLAGILYSGEKKKDVGMITIDTYRMGAVEQLKRYGEILDYPVESCRSVDEFAAALLRYFDKECVLIDTTGQNQKNIEVDDTLKEMVSMANPDKLALVLSATTKTEDLFDCINKFDILDINSIIISKVDETNSLGGIINIAYKYPTKKFAYFTTGQDVPSDIEAARTDRIIKSIIDAQ